MSISVLHTDGLAGNETTPSWTSTAGSTIIGFGGEFNATSSPSGTDFTDSKGNTWTLITGSYAGSNKSGSGMWYNTGGTRGSSHTLTYNPGTGSSFNIGVIEIAGTSITLVTGATAIGTTQTGSNPYGYPVTAGASVPSDNIALYMSTTDVLSGDGAWTDPSGYTDITNEPNANSNLTWICSYKLNESGTPTVSSSYSAATVGSTDQVQIFAAFQEIAPGQIIPSGISATSTLSGILTRYFSLREDYSQFPKALLRR